MKLMEVTPIEGKIIKDPKTFVRLEPGKKYKVPTIQFWLKRLSDGDVVLFVEKPKREKVSKKILTEKETGE